MRTVIVEVAMTAPSCGERILRAGISGAGVGAPMRVWGGAWVDELGGFEVVTVATVVDGVPGLLPPPPHPVRNRVTAVSRTGRQMNRREHEGSAMSVKDRLGLRIEVSDWGKFFDKTGWDVPGKGHTGRVLALVPVEVKRIGDLMR
jgi:hypothetical protein